jgi:excisionase family DNA binding protein
MILPRLTHEQPRRQRLASFSVLDLCVMKPSAEMNRSSGPRDTLELVLDAIADAITDRLEHRHDTRRRLLDMEQTCEYLSISEDTAYRLVAERKLTPVRVDRRLRFDIRELDHLIDDAKNSR